MNGAFWYGVGIGPLGMLIIAALIVWPFWHICEKAGYALRCHFIDDRVEPFDEQQLDIGCLAFYPYGVSRPHFCICDNPRQGKCRLLEGLGRRGAPAAQANIGIVRELLPSCLRCVDALTLQVGTRHIRLGSPRHRPRRHQQQRVGANP